VLSAAVSYLRAAPHRLYLAANVPLVAVVFVFLQYHTFLWGAMGLGATAAVVVGTFKNRPRHKGPWLLVALGLGTFIAGDISYDVLTRYMHQVNPFPSVADVFYLATYPLVGAGLYGLVRSRRRGPDGAALLDALIVASGGALLSWVYLIQPYVHAHHMAFVVKAVSIAYPLGDILILCLLARLLVAGRVRSASLALLSIGAGGLLAADCVYGWIQLHGNWKVGGPTDLGWVAFYVAWGAAALHPSMRRLTEKQPRQDRHISMSTLLVLGAATLVGPSVLVWRVVLDGQIGDAGMIAASSALSFVLVMARLTGLARSQAVLARREQALRAFSERLVAATDQHEVLASGVVAVSAMLGRSARACLLTEQEDGTERVSVSEPGGFEGLQVVVQDGPGPEPRAVGFVGNASAIARVSDRWRSVPLADRARKRYRLLVTYEGDLAEDVVEVLDALAAQLVIAFERVALAADLHKRRGEARFRSLIRSASDVIVVAQPDRPWASEAPSLEAVLGYPPGGTVATDMAQLLHRGDADQAAALVASMLSGGRAGPIRTEWRLCHADGRWLQMEVIANDLSQDPDVGGVVLTLRDVSDRRALEEELRHRAFHDGLTDLPNRVLFKDRVEQALSRMSRQGTSVSVLMMDVDDFKLVNDTLGHVAGDELLVQVGVRLASCLRRGDTAARLGGDEFAVCAEFDPSDRLDLTSLAQRVLAAFRAPFNLGGSALNIRVSLGIATAGDHTNAVADMLRQADLALYAAKNAGKGTFRFFEPELHEAVLARLERRAELEHAVGSDELRLYYQPIVNMVDGTILGLEALVRWQHPMEGLLPPSAFIPIAEESGLVVPMGEWVLDRACLDLARWRRAAEADGLPLYVSVNVSARQLQTGRFLEVVDEVLARHAIDPSWLTLEITESCLADDSDEVLACLQQIDRRGIKLSLDDFGTGYSSLSYLRRFPIRVLKIDRSFVGAMGTAEGLTLLEAIISMARTLGLALVAEGIESQDQVRELLLMGCGTGQGYLFWRPMPGATMDEVLREVPSTLVKAPAA
jgi:diguanylate cyclase (GGDEF)-like protein/PAS domain S-box-containing protein